MSSTGPTAGTSTGGADMDELRADIEQTRADLGDTVEALAAKADVKSRLARSAADARDRGRRSAAQLAGRAKQTAGTAAVVGRDRAARVGRSARRHPAPWAGVALAVLAVAGATAGVRAWKSRRRPRRRVVRAFHAVTDRFTG